jgi:hypothetical protein
LSFRKWSFGIIDLSIIGGPFCRFGLKEDPIEHQQETATFRGSGVAVFISRRKPGRTLLGFSGQRLCPG